ncbi:iron complex transport system ATP-binding protein [Tistlia consotensis]|uniref:Iron complex transport system ATP-binding protein n=1 Tax=Tistlia consotensis USBA 355 TaxID=560819 RepID=A0A1Y6CT90_9PROT|nr:ABC transporter ATP-binding protein [Tistlia consotensis]SMF76340.1 iron complex transport system ATP-binding protein [Tistlia consotensis USBA 355]SNS12699.1 iron complex transport system ATP-binding protein [Tistlia consotensis]
MSVVLRLAGFSVARAAHRIVRDLDARIEGPGLVAVCGPNGAGKSTLLAALAGHLPHRGSALLDGRAPESGDLAYLPQATRVGAGLTVLETVLLGRIDHLRWTVRPGDIRAAVEALQVLHLAHLAERRLDRLSGGQQQLVFVAQRLVRRPRLLLLDEPTSALDLNRQMILLEELQAYLLARNAIAVVALHDLSLAARFAATVLLMKAGRLVSCGSPAGVLTRETIEVVYGIRAELLTASSGQTVVVPLGPIRGTGREAPA